MFFLLVFIFIFITRKKFLISFLSIDNRFEIEELCRFVNKYYCTSSTFRLMYDKNNICKNDTKIHCVKFLNSKIVGCIRKKCIGENMYYIDLLCIHPLFRRCHLAKKLIDYAYTEGGSGMFTIDKHLSVSAKRKNWKTLKRGWKKYWIEIQGNQHQPEWILCKLPLKYKNLDVYEFQGISKTKTKTKIENIAEKYIMVSYRKCIKGKWNLFSEETIYCDKTFDTKNNFQPISF